MKSNIKILSIDDNSHITAPDFIYNRFDLYMSDYDKLQIDCQNKRYIIYVGYENNSALLGIWLYNIPVEVVKSVCAYIFNVRKNIKNIVFNRAYVSLGMSTCCNHFKISLPNSPQELDSRLSKKGRYNLQRQLRLLNDEFGSCKFVEYTNDNVPNSIIENYFSMKKATHNREYNMTAKNYLKEYHVTDIYALNINNEFLAILFSCEQCDTVYIENLTYNLKFSKFSPGIILYDYYLKRLIEKGKSEIFLYGGNLDYKKRFGSVEERVYDCTVYRHFCIQVYYSFLRFLKKSLKNIIKHFRGL